MLHICSQRALLGEKGTSIFYDLYQLPHSKFPHGKPWNCGFDQIKTNFSYLQTITDETFERNETSKTSRENAWKIPKKELFSIVLIERSASLKALCSGNSMNE